MWIHVPSTYSQSVVESEESSWGSTQPWMEELARSVTWKTKSVSPASLRRVWKTVPSIRRLSGLTSPPSTQNLGVAEWISSLGDSRVSPTVSREASSEKMTQGNSQEKSSESPTGLDFQLSFLKMSPESLGSTGTPFDPNYERWVTGLRRDSSRRQKRAHLISANGSSSWPRSRQWMTPKALDGEFTTPRTQGRSMEMSTHLQTQAITNWPTPNAGPQNDSDTTWPQRREELKEKWGNNGFGLTLGMAVTNWRTPASQESGISPERLEGELGSRMYDKETGRLAQYGLPQQVQYWMTPNTMDSLPPKSQEALNYEHDTARQGRSNPNNLRDQAAVQEGIANWPTPTGRDHKDGTSAETVPENGLLGRAAPNWANSRSIPQAPPTTKDGHTCSPSCRRLNPLFAEMLMGLPPGWTDDSEPLATESFRRWRRLLSALSAGY